MKTKYLGMLTVMAMLCLTACSNKEDLPQEAVEGMPICFQVTTSDMQSRTSHANANTIDQFGLRIQSKTEGIDYTAENIIFTGSGEDAQRIWTPEPVTKWQTGNHTVDMIAFYPTNMYGAQENPFTTPKEVSIEATQGADSYQSDILMAKRSDFNPANIMPANPAIDLTFKHVMSLLQVVITFPDGTTYPINDINAINIIGSKLKGNITASNTQNIVTAVDHSEGLVSAYRLLNADNGVNTATFNCILVPQTIASGNLKIVFMINDKYFEWISKQEIKLAENTIHTLSLTVKDVSAAQTQSMQSRSWGGHTAYEVISNSMN